RPMILPRPRACTRSIAPHSHHGIDFERALLQLRFLPALREVLDPASGAFRIIFVILNLKAFGGEEALFDRDTPGAIVAIAVALQSYGWGLSVHGAILSYRQSAQGRTLDKAVASFNAMPAGRSLRLAVGVGARIARRSFVVAMPAGIEQQRHQRDADRKRKHN